jgi:hypothetical protein
MMRASIEIAMEEFGGEAAVKRPSPLPLLSGSGLINSLVKVDELVEHGG